MRIGVVIGLVLVLAGSAEGVERKVFAGGLYADVTPGGRWVVAYADHLESSAGRLPLPPGETGALFNRVSPDLCPFAVATKGHATGKVWVWRDGQWMLDGRISHGTQGHIWQPDCHLFVLEPCAHCESQGIRYWDNGPVYGSPTYDFGTHFARSLGVMEMWEWSRCPGTGIFVGQGAHGGAAVQVNRALRLLEPGDTRFIQFKCNGGQLAVAITKFAQREAVTLRLTTADLAGLPLYATSTPPTPPAPEPEPEPEPEPQRPVPDPERALWIVQQERNAFAGYMSEERIVLFLRRVAARLNAERLEGGPFGVLKKESGSNCLGYSCDIICAGSGAEQRQWDVLGDVDGAQSAGWNGPIETIVVRECEVVPAGPGTEPEPEPSPELEARLRELEQLVEALDARLRVVENRPVGLTESHVNALIEHAFRTAIVEGRTESAGWGPFSHGHAINLRIRF